MISTIKQKIKQMMVPTKDTQNKVKTTIRLSNPAPEKGIKNKRIIEAFAFSYFEGECYHFNILYTNDGRFYGIEIFCENKKERLAKSFVYDMINVIKDNVPNFETSVEIE